MARKPGAPKIDGVNFHLIIETENFDYVYDYYRREGMRSVAQAFNRIIADHRKKSGTKKNPVQQLNNKSRFPVQ